MRSLEQVNIRTNVRTYVRTYVLTYIRTGQTLYPLHNFVVRGDNDLNIRKGKIILVKLLIYFNLICVLCTVDSLYLKFHIPTYLLQMK